MKPGSFPSPSNALRTAAALIALFPIHSVQAASPAWLTARDEEARELVADFGSDPHREVPRAAVPRSLVLLKNEGGVLPLSRKVTRIQVTGRGTDDLGMQCGGWTVDWQGKRSAVTPGGTTILEAIRLTVVGDLRDPRLDSGEGER